jgi:hypothetical protein
MMIAAVSANDVPVLAPVLEELFWRVVKRSSGRMTTDDVIELVARQRAKLWLATEGESVLGGLIAMPVQYSRRKALSVLFIAGQERERWELPMIEMLEEGARRIGCDLLEGLGRRGFARLYPGWQVTGYSLEKDLSGMGA